MSEKVEITEPKGKKDIPEYCRIFYGVEAEWWKNSVRYEELLNVKYSVWKKRRQIVKQVNLSFTPDEDDETAIKWFSEQIKDLKEKLSVDFSSPESVTVVK